jgi:hypothetical protein
MSLNAQGRQFVKMLCYTPTTLDISLLVVKRPRLCDSDALNGEMGFVTFEYPLELSEDEAMSLQEMAGFHPEGYGFYRYEFGTRCTTWMCSTSCD